mmetsp:Transcript_33713/g.108358  ORF Transcript_33713/g.108358 Transcript_33713/m.108358 type:complete len:210 (-) Transcript_33713:30-659(-)
MVRCTVEEEEAAAVSARLVGLGVDRGERDAGADAEHRDCDGEARLVEPQEDREEKDPDGNRALRDRVEGDRDVEHRQVGAADVCRHREPSRRHAHQARARSVKQMQLGQAEQPHQQPRSRHLDCDVQRGDKERVVEVVDVEEPLVVKCERDGDGVPAADPAREARTAQQQRWRPRRRRVRERNAIALERHRRMASGAHLHHTEEGRGQD